LRVIVFSFGSRAGWLEPEEAIMTGFALRCLFDDRTGQDLIEYALALGAVVMLAGFCLPDVASGLEAIFHRITGVLAVAAQSHDYYGVN